MSKIAKKGRNPGAVDNWLDTLGLYRKNVAYDETCLFRAISEQLFDCQVYHERVRRDCLVFARENYEELSSSFESVEHFFDHLEKLEKHMVICGDTELNIISKKYNRSITIFDASVQQIYHLADEEFHDVFLLCLMDRDHYDVVYNKEHITTAGFCQSIVYKILYEDVFQVPNVDEIVHNMLYDKGNIITQAELMMEKKRILTESGSEELTNEELEEKLDIKSLATVNIAPFPFKIAKALDPNIYRNIEYDSWGEMRREWRLGDWYYGDNKLILGTKCIYNDVHLTEKFECYIQEIIKNQNKCVIYITKLAEKRTVAYSDLSPEDDAKPWPLPYRFSKSVAIGPTTPTINKHATKPKRRNNKENNRTKSESSALSSTVMIKHEAIVDNVDAYVGIPLQMHSSSNNESVNVCRTEISTETQTEPIVSQEATPHAMLGSESADNSWYPNGYQWQPYMAPPMDPFVWPTNPPPSQNIFNFNMKPMVASAPVTPNVIPYHDPYYYNYHVEPCQTYPQWPSPPFELQAPPPPRNQQKLQKQENSEVSHAQNGIQVSQQQHCNSAEISNNYDTHNNMNTNRPEIPPLNYISQPRTPLGYSPHCAPCTPIELYSTMSPVVQMPPMPPGPPIMYATAPPEMTEVLMPSTPPVIYTPPVEIPYIQSTPYVYPPTPPTAWYPTGITTQGFIFPPHVP